MKTRSVKQVNEYLRVLGYKEEIWKNFEGGPYFVWSGGDAHNWYQNSTHVPRVTDLSMERWIEERNWLASGGLAPAGWVGRWRDD